MTRLRNRASRRRRREPLPSKREKPVKVKRHAMPRGRTANGWWTSGVVINKQAGIRIRPARSQSQKGWSGGPGPRVAGAKRSVPRRQTALASAVTPGHAALSPRHPRPMDGSTEATGTDFHSPPGWFPARERLRQRGARLSSEWQACAPRALGRPLALSDFRFSPVVLSRVRSAPSPGAHHSTHRLSRTFTAGLRFACDRFWKS